jgi:hypothetical protein
MRKLLGVIAVLMLSVVGYAQQPLTLIERVRVTVPGPFIETRTAEIVPDTIEEGVPAADLVMYGRVTAQSTAYLNADKTDLNTDFTIEPMRVLARRFAEPPKGKPAGQPSTIVVKRWGGETTLEGISVTQRDAHFPFYKIGDELLLFLRLEQDGKYTVNSSFGVVGGRIRPFIQHPKIDKYQGLPIDQVGNTIVALAKR